MSCRLVVIAADNIRFTADCSRAFSFLCAVTLRLEGHLVFNSNHGPFVPQRKVVPILAKEIVPKRRIPAEQEVLWLVHRDVHGVRNFHSRRKIVVSRHRDLARYLQPERFLPERHLMHHVLENVSARIIPEEPPIDKPLRIKFMRSRLTLEFLPRHVVEVAVRRDLPLPPAIGMVPVMMRVNGCDGSHALRSSELPRACKCLPACGLHTDLHHAI